MRFLGQSPLETDTFIALGKAPLSLGRFTYMIAGVRGEVWSGRSGALLQGWQTGELPARRTGLARNF